MELRRSNGPHHTRQKSPGGSKTIFERSVFFYFSQYCVVGTKGLSNTPNGTASLIYHIYILFIASILKEKKVTML